MAREKLIRKEVTSQHSGESSCRDAGINLAKFAFFDAADDQLLDQGNKPADKLFIERLRQGMVFQRTVIIETQKDRIECFRKTFGNQAKRLLNRDIAALRRVNNAGEPLILEFLPENRGNKILLRREVAKDERFIQPRPTRD